MEITMRSAWTLIHGMGFGALYLLACSGALIELYRVSVPGSADTADFDGHKFLRIYLCVMVVLAWVTVLSGAYIVYPWYRAVAPAGTADLSMFPQLLLKSSPSTIGWHSFGMEWKEHVAWLTPISITMVAVVFMKYGRDLRNHPGLRSAVLGFTLVSFVAAGIAGFSGAMINKYAPVQGGPVIHLVHGE